MQVYGIDLSKEKFDVNYLDSNGKESIKMVKNNLSSISRFLEGVPPDSILCCEHTGVYGDLLLHLSDSAKIRICFIPGYTLKHSLGLSKGKSDQLDARRIREYGERFSDKLRESNSLKEPSRELHELYTLREQFVKARKSLSTSQVGRSSQSMQSICVYQKAQRVIEKLTKEISEINDEIEKVIQADPEMETNYQLLKSVKGIGPVIATDLLIKTGNFQILDSARKAASYAGVCPFPNSSGKMVIKSKTSPFADKKLKSLLYMGAKSAVKYNKEYQLYYQKKKIQGKPHFLIMNNIANKMLRTVYSIIKSKIPWDQAYICLDPREKIISS